MPPEIVQWLQNMSFATAIRESALVFPVILSLHLTGMGLFGGMILMTDLRILGIAMTKRPISDVVNGLRPWKHLGLTLTAGCGTCCCGPKPRSTIRTRISGSSCAVRSDHHSCAGIPERVPERGRAGPRSGDSGPGQIGGDALAGSVAGRAVGRPVDRVLGAEGRAGQRGASDRGGASTSSGRF